MLQAKALELAVGGFALGVTAEVQAGERVALLGASGSGKSTLLSALSGFLVPDAGEIWAGGQNITHLPVAARPMSVLFQDGNLFPHLSVFDNVALGLRTDLRLSAAEAKLVEECLEQTGLGGMGPRLPRALSGGQRSRVALARMFLRDQPIALLDEPFAALDPGLRSEMLTVLAALCEARGLTLLMATHDLRDAERLCDRVWFLQDDKLAVDLPVDGLREAAPDLLRPWL